MGDVALTVPVIKSLVQQYPKAEIVLLTNAAFKPFFSSIKGITIIESRFKAENKGLLGIFRLFRQIKKIGRINYVIDIHDVLRSKALRFLFMVTGSRVFVIDKGRKEKKKLIKTEGVIILKHTVDRYCDVFKNAGFPVTPSKGPAIVPEEEALAKAERLFSEAGLKIGVAPYAKHDLKMWPEENMVELLNLIAARNNVQFYLMGGGIDEVKRLESFEKMVPRSNVIAGKFTLTEELALISRLDFMICMDSSNMHMAALTGIKVISIWGATHRAAGFGPVNQPDEYMMQIPETELTCRPCTIYGTGICRRGDHACMNWQTPQVVLNKLIKLGLIK